MEGGFNSALGAFESETVAIVTQPCLKGEARQSRAIEQTYSDSKAKGRSPSYKGRGLRPEMPDTSSSRLLSTASHLSTRRTG